MPYETISILATKLIWFEQSATHSITSERQFRPTNLGEARKYHAEDENCQIRQHTLYSLSD